MSTSLNAARSLFDEVVVVVMHNAAKTYHVSAQQRVDWIEQSVAHLPNVRVDACGGLLAEYAVQCGAKFIVKGVRDAADMVVETQMYYANREASQGRVDTLHAADAGGVCLSELLHRARRGLLRGRHLRLCAACYFRAGGQGLSEGIKKHSPDGGAGRKIS